MSQFNITGNINAVNQQIGNGNTLDVTNQKIQIDWNRLQCSVKAMENQFKQDEERAKFQKCCDLLERRDKKGIKEFFYKNFQGFGLGVLSSMSASVLVELIKILL